jgi:hypothetical protein
MRIPCKKEYRSVSMSTLLVYIVYASDGGPRFHVPVSCVLIMAYELSHSSYVMNLAYWTLILVIHTTYMIKIRTKLRWRFVVPSGLPMSYACRSVGSESRGIWVVSLYTGVVLGYTGTFGCDGAPWLRGRRQVMTTLSIPCNLSCLDIRIGVHKVSHACWQTSAQRSPRPSYTKV